MPVLIQRQGRDRRQNFMDTVRREQQVATVKTGVLVVVLKAAKYNGPNHKTLGHKEPGDVISIPVDALDFLVAEGFVQPYSETEPPMPDLGALSPSPDTVTDGLEKLIDTLAPPTPEPSSLDPDGWKVFKQAGLTDRQAQALYDAGLSSKEDLADLLEVEGEEKLNAVNGITDAAVRKLVAWVKAD
jgi:hypothetical protein